MPSILEYAETEFSLLAEKPFTDVDSLLLSQFSYMNLSAFEDELKCENKIEIRELLKAERFEKLMFHVRDTKSNMRLLYAMASSPRWRNIKIGNFVEKLCDQSEEQFAAITVYLDDDHACAVFRGTDATLVGWKEDFNMAFLPVIPSQADAADYVTKLGKSFPGKLLLMGHSKGGNLAAYAGMFCDPEIQKRIERVYPLDSPGFIGNTLESEEYGRIQSRVHKVIPKGSLIGMLLENHGAYSVVESNQMGIMQHDPFSWEVRGKDFCYAEDLDKGSVLVNQTVHQWLAQCTREQRRKFVDAIFDLLASTQRINWKEMHKDVHAGVTAIRGVREQIDIETARMIANLLGRLAVIGAGNALEMLRQKTPFQQESAQKEQGGLEHV